MGEQLRLSCVPQVPQGCFPGLPEHWHIPKLDPGGPFLPPAKARLMWPKPTPFPNRISSLFTSNLFGLTALPRTPFAATCSRVPASVQMTLQGGSR